MPRRIALALALAFTTVVTVAVVGVGAQAGIFSDHKTAKAREALADTVQTDMPPASPIQAVSPTPQQQDPQIVTEYVYVDEPVGPGVKAEAVPSTTPKAKPSPTAQPSETPEPEATQRPAPTATRPAAATATPASQSTPQPTATQQAPAPQPKELEFAGTVTAIDGNQVTFSYSGKTVVVQVSNAGALSVGSKAHVHAILTSSGYVATEIEAGG